MAQSDKCPFCDVEQSYRRLLENEYAFAMYPKSPVIPYHILLIPKQHIQCFDELDGVEVLDLHQLLKQFVAIGKEHIGNFVGYNILSNNGTEAVNQRVKHCHMHLFLRGNNEIAPIVTANVRDPVPLTETELKHLTTLKKWLKASP